MSLKDQIKSLFIWRAESYSTWKILLIALFFWGGLFFKEVPNPHPDDTVYVGSAIHFAEKGYLWNTLTPGILQDFKIFPYVTFFSWTLGGWFKLFGVSTLTLLGFHFVLNTLHSLFLAGILKYFKFPIFYWLSINLVYAGLVDDLGSRPNTLSMTFLTLGLFLMTKKNRIFEYWAWCSLGLSVISLPYMAVFGVLVGACYLSQKNHLLQKNQVRSIVQEGFVLMASFLTVVLFWAASVHGRCLEWIEAYLKVAQLNATPFASENWKEGWYYAWKSISAGWNLLLFGPAYLMAIINLIYSLINYRKISRNAKNVLIVFWIGMTLAAILYSVFFTMILAHSAVIYCILMGYFYRESIKDRFSLLMQFAGFVLIPGLLCIKILTLSFQKKMDINNKVIILDTLRQHPDKRVILDSSAWRSIFQYKAPPHSVAVDFCVPQEENCWVAHFRDLKMKSPNDILILHAFYFHGVLPETGIRFTPLQVGSVKFNSIKMYPNEIKMFE
jgi:hypothetical protein